MAEYATRQLNRSQLLHELAAVCEDLVNADVEAVVLMYGWDSNQSIDAMWKPLATPSRRVCDVVSEAEKSGLIEIGKSDVFVDAEGFSFMLCHEGDVHVRGESALVARTAARWFDIGLDPREIDKANPSFQRTAMRPLN